MDAGPPFGTGGGGSAWFNIPSPYARKGTVIRWVELLEEEPEQFDSTGWEALAE